MSERGSITLWVLGLAIAVLFLGGISIDLWRVMSDRRELAAVADSSAVAAASAIDADVWRTSGEIVLVRDRAVYLADRVVAQHGVAGELSSPMEIDVAGDTVRVALERVTDLTLLKLLAVGEDPLVVRVVSTARATASP